MDPAQNRWSFFETFLKTQGLDGRSQKPQRGQGGPTVFLVWFGFDLLLKFKPIPWGFFLIKEMLNLDWI